MSFSMTNFISGLQHAVAAVETLLPVATALGAPTGMVQKVTDIAGAAIDVAQNVSTRIDEGKIVATSQDQDQLKTVLASLQAKNDELAAYIDSH